MARSQFGRAAVLPGGPLDDRQAEPEPAGVARPRAVEPREGLDGFLAQMFGDAGAVVGDLDFNVSLAAEQPHLDLAPEAQRIAEQVEKRALPFDAMASGRASCRERVCQYVMIPVVAVSLKNKKRETKIKM